MGPVNRHSGGSLGLISRPIVILGAPRSGTTMLFEALSSHPELWSLYRESDQLMHRHFRTTMVPGISDLIRDEQIDEEVAKKVEQEFFEKVGNTQEGSALIARVLERSVPMPLRNFISKSKALSGFRMSVLRQKAGRSAKKPPIRIVDKNPENCFRIALLRRAFPDAMYLYVVRHPLGSIASIYDGWLNEPQFRNYPFPPWFRIKGYAGAHWCFGLLPDWEQLNGASLIEVCARQWLAYNRQCQQDLLTLDVLQVHYEALVESTDATLRGIAEWADVDPEPLRKFASGLPTTNTRTMPSADKWRRFEEELAEVRSIIIEEAAQLGYEIA
jgi:hypothetical protein